MLRLSLPMQRGFVKGRQLLDNVFDVEAAVERYLYHEGNDPGVFLFDVEAAFPSAAQPWIWQVLERMGLPCRLRRAVQFLYKDVHVRFLLNGRLSERSICVRSGVKQGCPSSGFLWALLYDPVLRAMSCTLPPRELAITCFADDLAAAALRVRRAFPLFVRCFEQVRKATRLKLNIKKTELVYFGARCFAEVSAEMAEEAGGETMVVSGRGAAYVGAPTLRRGFGTKPRPKSGELRDTSAAYASRLQTGHARTGCSGRARPGTSLRCALLARRLSAQIVLRSRCCWRCPCTPWGQGSCRTSGSWVAGCASQRWEF